MNKIMTTWLIKTSFILLFLLISSCSIQTAENTATSQITPSIDKISTTSPIISTKTITTTTTTASPVQTRAVPTVSVEAVATEIKLPTPTAIPLPVSWIAFADGQFTAPVGIIKTDGTGYLKFLTKCIFCNSISWSPDGHWLAYDATFDPQDKGQIYISKWDRSEAKQITFGVTRKTDVAWSPDGQNIAYVELGDTETSDDICIVNKDTGETKKLTYTNLTEAAPAWSPDGKYIAYKSAWIELGHTTNVVWFLMVMDRDGENERQITKNWIGNGRISWSPDGKRIAYTSQGDCGDIYTIEVDSGRLKRLTNFVGCAINPSWSPDGKYIAFEASNIEAASGIYSLAAVPAEGGPMTIISRYVYGRPDWMPVPSLQIAGLYRITEAGSHLNLRDKPSVNGDALEILMAGDQVTIVGGPVDADNYYWWKLRTQDGVEGWAVEVYGWYQPATP